MAIIRNKKGVSVIIGYVLLVAIVVVISIFVYQWLKTYIPQNALQCPSGVSVSIPSYTYNCTTGVLNFTLENTGTFSISGYFIHASNQSGQVASVDLSPYYIGGSSISGNGILFNYYNVIPPGNAVSSLNNVFNLSKFPPFTGALTEITIIPIRYVQYNNKNMTASCGNAQISEPISCS